jgi:hypothetical protein
VMAPPYHAVLCLMPLAALCKVLESVFWLTITVI